jgi:hypothetical protein
VVELHPTHTHAGVTTLDAPSVAPSARHRHSSEGRTGASQDSVRSNTTSTSPPVLLTLSRATAYRCERSGVSGVAVQRLMFDFENVVSNAEAEFDTGLLNRIRLISNVYRTMGRADGTFDEITISHKRNAPLNLKEFADTALVMSQTGFSDYLVADVMPDDIIPDVDEELARQKEDREGAIPDVEVVAARPTDGVEVEEEADNGNA